jgi:hypothetical protein
VKEDFASFLPYLDRLHRIQDDLVEFLKTHGATVNSQYFLSLPIDAPVVAHRACDALSALTGLRVGIKRNDVRAIINNAVEFGRLLERLQITPHEPNAATGRK